MDRLLEKQIKESVKDAFMDIAKTRAERKSIFGSDTEDLGGQFKSFGEFLATVKDKPNDGRLVKALSEGTDSLGGFLVPQQFAKQILMNSLEKAIIRRFATVIPMASDTINIPKVTDTTHASDVYGGLVGVWVEESGSATVDEPTFGQLKLIAKKLLLYTETSNELLADSAIALEALILKLFGDTLAYYEDQAFIDGDGVGKPLGI